MSALKSSPAMWKAAAPCAVATRSKPALVGVDPAAVRLMEDHHEAYYAWRALGLKDRWAIHVDAHLDFGWIPDASFTEVLQTESRRDLDRLFSAEGLWHFGGARRESLIDIGNYLHPALQEGLLKGFYWVVPDAFMSTWRQRRRLEGLLRVLQKIYPPGLHHLRWIGRTLHAEMLGKPVAVCTLSQLPTFDEPVLLDIDIDFFVVDTISRRYPHARRSPSTPWLWPDELIALLRERRVRTDLVTIAYSVEGGFTPLEYRYLGDELATSLRTPDLSVRQRDNREQKRLLAQSRLRGNRSDTVRICDQALVLHAEDPSLHFVRAQLALDQGNQDKARAHYEACVRLDARYRTRYSQLGPVFIQRGRFRRAATEFRKALTWDSRDVEAQRGLAEALYGQRRWRASLGAFKALHELAPDDSQIHLALGKCYVQCGDYDLAETHLRLASESAACRPLAHYWLGLRFWRTGRWAEALAAFKAARQDGIAGPSLHVRLALLYLCARRWPEAVAQFVKAGRQLASCLRPLVPAASPLRR